MTTFVDPIAWEFQPTFPVRRLIDARGGVLADDERYTAPFLPGSRLRDLRQTFHGLDRVVVALILAGYEVPGMVVATGAHGDAWYQQSYAQLFPLSGLALPVYLPWPQDTHIADDAALYNFVALRVLAWRDLAYPEVRPVSLATVPGYQAYADPADPDASPADGWLLVGAPSEEWTDRLMAKQGPSTATHVGAAVAAAYRASPADPPGLVRMLDSATWEVPRDRTAGLGALVSIGETIMNWLRAPGQLERFLSWSLEEREARMDKLALTADPDIRTTLLDAFYELHARRVLLQPLEAGLPGIIGAAWKTHWLLYLMQLHEYGLLSLLPRPAAAPAIPVLDLTGFYTTKTVEDPVRSVVASMQLSQAGEQLEGWWWDSQMRLSRFTGTLDRDAFAAGRFEFPINRPGGVTGKLYLPGIPPGDYVGAFGMYLTWGGATTYTMARRERNARPGPDTIAATFAQQLPNVAIEPFVVPLHWLVLQRVEALADELIAHIDTVSAILDEGPVVEVTSMNNAVAAQADRDDLVVTAAPSGYVTTPLLERLRGELHLRLLKHQVPGAGADAWRQLASIVSLWPLQTKGLQALLELAPSAPHQYTYDIAGIGAELSGGLGIEFGAGSFSVASAFNHLECPGPDEDPNWTDRYHGTILQAGVSVGLEGGARAVLVFKEGANDLTTAEEWFPDDFLCTFVVDEFVISAGGYSGPGGEYARETEGFIFYRARDGAPAGGSGGGWVVQGGIGAGAGLSGSLTGIWGWYSRRDGTAPDPPPAPPPAPVPIGEVRGGSPSTAYFDADSATLLPEAKAEIAKLALAHRALLEDSGSFLVLEGDASRTDTDPHNRALSRARVHAVYDYLRALLTAPETPGRPASSGLAIPQSHVRISAYGESRPASAGLPDELEQAEWRKATLVLRGRAVVTLQAAVVL